jgi:Lrp/AsnC family transcriptional regulator
MDRIDRKILSLLQVDATLSLADVAEQVNLSPTPCWRRVQRLERDGVIRGRVALLDAAKLNVGVTVFVRLKTDRHDKEWLDDFANRIASIPEVVEIYRMSGDIDYILKVVVPDIAAYDVVRSPTSVPTLPWSASRKRRRCRSTTSDAGHGRALSPVDVRRRPAGRELLGGVAGGGGQGDRRGAARR